MAKIKTTKRINVATASFPVTLLAASNVESILIHGTKTLSADIAITYSGTFKDGAEISFTYVAAITPGVWKLTILGIDFPTDYYSDYVEIKAKYLNSAWILVFVVDVRSTFVHKTKLHADVVDGVTVENNSTVGLRVKDGGISADKLATASVETAKMKAGNVTLDKMERRVAKSIIIGKGAGVDVAELVGTTGEFLVIGDTNPEFVAIAGNVSVDKTGASVIGAGVITAAMMGAEEITNNEIAVAAGIEFSKMEELTNHNRVLVSGATGITEEDGTTQTELQVINGVTPGILSPGKALVVDGGGTVDVLGITAPYFNGVAVTKSAADINKNASTIKSKSANYVILDADDVIFVDTTGGNVTLTLPDLATSTSKIRVFRKIVAGNDLIIQRAGTDTIQNLALADVTAITLTGGAYQTKIAHETTKWREIT